MVAPFSVLFTLLHTYVRLGELPLAVSVAMSPWHTSVPRAVMVGMPYTSMVMLVVLVHPLNPLPLTVSVCLPVVAGMNRAMLLSCAFGTSSPAWLVHV